MQKKQVGDTKTEVAILKKAASILRRKTLEHIKNNPVIFQGTVENNQNSCPFVLSSFTKWLLSGPSTKKRNDVVESHINGLSQTISYNIMHNTMTDRQAKYESAKAENYRSRHSYVPEHNIALGLALRSYDRNNDVLKLLSAPNFGFTIPPRICVKWETAIGNAVLENMSKNGSYIPTGLVKNQVVLYHLDNIDWLEDTPDGKNTSHFLLLVAFQRRVTERQSSVLLDIDQNQISLTLNNNSFNELIPYNKPNPSMFLRAPGCENACIDDQRVKSKILRPWLHLRSFERLIVDTGPDGNNDENEACESATVENYGKTSVFDVLQKKYSSYSFSHHSLQLIL